MENLISTALVIASVQKAIALVLCAAFCSCFICGCVASSPTQNESTQAPDGLQAAEISLSPASVTLAAPVSIRAILKDSNGQALNGKVVEWFIDGRSIGKSQMKNGITTLMLTGDYTNNLRSGVHEMQVNFYGDADYRSVTATAILTINATETTSEAVPSEVPASTPVLRSGGISN